MPQPTSRPYKEVPPHSREQGRVQVSGYTAKNPGFFRRKTINLGRLGKVTQTPQGQTLVTLPYDLFKELVSGQTSLPEALHLAGIQEWELTSDNILLGNDKNRVQIPLNTQGDDI